MVPTAEEEANPELVDMTRRFWVCAMLTAPLFLIAMADMLPGNPLGRLIGPTVAAWIEFVLADSRRALGRLAVFRARLGFDRASQSEYVHVDRDRRRRGVSL